MGERREGEETWGLRPSSLGGVTLATLAVGPWVSMFSTERVLPGWCGEYS